MAIDRMVEGRLRKYFEEVVLMEQKFVVDDSKNIKVLVRYFHILRFFLISLAFISATNLSDS